MYNPGKLLKEIPPYTSILIPIVCCFFFFLGGGGGVDFDTKEANFENDIASEKCL